MIATTRKAKVASLATTRVAIYCRQSVEDATSEFGSLQAQREAVEAYVTSQRGEGWSVLADRYDDAGFSGATVERPAFKRLIADVEGGRVDVVAVYKIDRLSRSLLDFTRLMEMFRRHSVTFVSVTQQFSTTTPVGRMTLNLLATFAEFERETIAERTRDKMQAARRRGLWTGGPQVLGYDLVSKRLLVNAVEAERVRAIFELFLERGRIIATVEELRRRGWGTKQYTTQLGGEIASRQYSKDSLRRFLSDPRYIGKVRCGDDVADGMQEAIVDQSTWDAVQRQLSVRPLSRPPQSKNPGLLARLVTCFACGASMGYTCVSTHGLRRSYLVCRRVQKHGASACPGSRVSAPKLEGFVVERIRSMGRDPALIREVVAAAKRDLETRRPEVEAELARLEADRERLAGERANLVAAVAQRGPAQASLVGALAEADDALAAASERAAVARAELARIDDGQIDEEALRAALAEMDQVWAELFPAERYRVLALLVERITFDGRTKDVEITFRAGAGRVG